MSEEKELEVREIDDGTRERVWFWWDNARRVEGRENLAERRPLL